MAEPTNLPHGSAAQPAETGITAMPAMPSTEKPESYRPISLLAILGFSLACVYAVVIFGGAVVSLAITRTPWLMPVSTLIFPLAAFVLCLIARLRILSSEGTLAGLPLTKWGMTLCFVFALVYVAYYAATAVAVRQQAETFATQFFDTLKKGDIDRAFLLTRPPSSRPPDGPNQRDAIENEHNDSPDPKTPGAYSDFLQKDYVRLLQNTGANCQVQFRSVGDWEYKEAGFRVPLRYQIITPLLSFEMVLTVQSREGRGKDAKGRVEAKGRQWMVVAEETRLDSNPQPTPEGEALLQRYASAREFAEVWAQAVADGRDWFFIYLMLLSPEERKRVVELLESKAPLMAATGAAPLLFGDKDWLAFVSTRAQLAGADFVRTDKEFWADPKVREEMSTTIRKILQEGSREDQPVTFSLPKRGLPLWSIDGDKVRFGIDCLLLQLTKYKAEGLIFVEADNAKEVLTPSDWRINRVEILRARSAPPPGMMGMMGGP